MEYFLFDLDGTLTDPGEGITNSVMYALAKFGIEENDRSKLYDFIGPPLVDSFAKYYGFDEEKSNLGVKYFREYFNEKGIFENKLYAGIKEMLAFLASSKKFLVIATSKPEPMAQRIIDNFGLNEYIDHLCGAELNERGRCRKEDIISYAIDKYGIKAEKAVMIGDRSFDILGGKKFGFFTIGVSYGYGGRCELEESGADMIADDPKELKRLFEKLL